MGLKVLFLQQMAEPLQSYFQEKLSDLGIDLIFLEDPTEEELEIQARDADVLIGWRPEYQLLKRAVRAKVFINPGVGVKRHIEPFRKLNASREEPLILINGHGNAYFTAEHAVALLLALYNKIVPYHNNMVSGGWRENDPGSSLTLRHKMIGLLGYGAINRYVHQFLRGFEVQFSALKRTWSEDIDDLVQYTPDQLHDFLDSIDILILALPHTQDTEGMIGETELQLLGKEAVVINVARGVIIDEQAFFTALAQHQIAGAGIDVWYNYEPTPDENGAKYPADYKFHELDNVVLSPHRAASPFEDLQRWDEQIENIRRIAGGRTDLLNIVDLDREY